MEIVVPTIAAILFALMTTLLVLTILKRRMRSSLGTFDSSHSQLRIKEELDRLLVEIQEISREHVAKMDNKIRMLNQLIADADERIRVLESPPTRTPAAKPQAPERPKNPLHEEVYALRNSGKSAAEISSATGRDIGEIELILGLREVK